jgi:predicted DNA-binding protein
MKNEDQDQYDEEKLRVVTLLSQEEKDDLQILAWKSGRSMSGYIRHLVIEEIEDKLD